MLAVFLSCKLNRCCLNGTAPSCWCIMQQNRYKYTLLIDIFALLIAVTVFFCTRLMLLEFPPCVLLSKYGITCPSCGGTRCVNYFFSFRLFDSFLIHPVVFLVIVYLLVILLVMNLSLFSSYCDGILKKISRPECVVIWAVVYACYGILRGFVLYF